MKVGAIAGAAVIAGAVAGTLVAPVGAATSDHTQYATNAHGQTYGSALDAKSPSDLPDLVSVVADNGIQGYIKSSDFEGPSLTRDQVLSLARDANGNFTEPPRTVPVYAQDGTTQVGVFTFSAGGSDPAPQHP